MADNKEPNVLEKVQAYQQDINLHKTLKLTEDALKLSIRDTEDKQKKLAISKELLDVTEKRVKAEGRLASHAQTVPVAAMEHPGFQPNASLYETQEATKITSTLQNAAKYYNDISKSHTTQTLSQSQMMSKAFTYGWGDPGSTIAGYIGGNVGKAIGGNQDKWIRNTEAAWKIGRNIWGAIGDTSSYESQIGTRLGIMARSGTSGKDITNLNAYFAQKYGWDPTQSLQTQASLSFLGAGAFGSMDTIAKAEKAFGISKETQTGMVGALRGAGYTGEGVIGPAFIKTLSEAFGKAIDDKDLAYFAEEQLKVMQKWSTAGQDPFMMMKSGAATMAAGGWLSTPSRAANYSDWKASLGNAEPSGMALGMYKQMLEENGIFKPGDDKYFVTRKVMAYGYEWGADDPGIANDEIKKRLASKGMYGPNIQKVITDRYNKDFPGQKGQMLGMLGLLYPTQPGLQGIENFQRFINEGTTEDSFEAGMERLNQKFGAISGTDEYGVAVGMGISSTRKAESRWASTLAAVYASLSKKFGPVTGAGMELPLETKAFLQSIGTSSIGINGISADELNRDLMGPNTTLEQRAEESGAGNLDPVLAATIGAFPWKSRITNINKETYPGLYGHKSGLKVDMGGSKEGLQETLRRADYIKNNFPWVEVNTRGPGTGRGEGKEALHNDITLKKEFSLMNNPDLLGTGGILSSYDPTGSSLLPRSMSDLIGDVYGGGGITGRNTGQGADAAEESFVDVLKKIEANTKVVADSVSGKGKRHFALEGLAYSIFTGYQN